MTARSNTPGRKKIKGRWRWVATDIARKKGFLPRTAPLPDDESAHEAICTRLWAEMEQWLRGEPKRATAYDGTISSLAEIYQKNDVSPFHSLEPRTQRSYSNTLRSITTAVGARRVDALSGEDFRRWHRKWADRGLRQAQEHMKLCRIILNFGAENRLHGCKTAAEILSLIEFSAPPKRASFLTRDHAEAIIETALARGDAIGKAIALGQAIQFETTLRQTDVIGVWRPRPRALEIEPGMVVTRQKYWSDGLTWERIATGRIVGAALKGGGREHYDFDLALLPLTSRVLALFSHNERTGPLIAREPGVPMQDDHYRKTWRRIATAAGVPKAIWNRDSRAGGLTEATQAGVPLEDLRHLAGHSNAATTAGYARGRAEKIERALKARLDLVQTVNEHGKPDGKPTVSPAKEA